MNAHPNQTERDQRSALRHSGHHFATFRSACALLLAAGCLTLAPVDARAHVIMQPVSIIDFGAPSGFGFSFAAPIVGFTGMVQVTTSVIGVFGEGGLRDGVSLTPNGAGLVTGGVIDSSNVSHVVNNVGGAASFAGAGGTAGAFQIGTAAVSDPGAPSGFGFSFTQPISVSGTVTSQSNFGAAVMDFFADGASVTGNTPAGRLSRFGVNGTTHTELGPSFSATGPAGSELDSGVATLGCNLAPCASAETGFSFVLSGGGDAAVFLGRQEIGGDPISGTVMQLYALVTQTSVFDCSVGCDFSQLTLSFVASGGGDSYGFIMRQEIIDFVAPVPEPASIALVGLGLAGWFATRRRVRPVAN